MEATIVSHFLRAELVGRHVGGNFGYNIIPFDEHGDYLLWEKQVKVILQSMGLICLGEKPSIINEIEWSAAQDQAVCTVLAYLDPTILKQVEEYSEVSKLLDVLQQRFH